MTIINHPDPIKKSWLELLNEEAQARGININFPFQLWDFNLDEENFIAGKVHNSKRKNYDEPNKDRIFFGSEDEVYEGNRIYGKTISVILDIHSDGEEFDSNLDRFIFADSELSSNLPSKEEKPTIYIEDSGYGYYYYHPTGSNNKVNIEYNNWDILFDMVEKE